MTKQNTNSWLSNPWFWGSVLAFCSLITVCLSRGGIFFIAGLLMLIFCVVITLILVYTCRVPARLKKSARREFLEMEKAQKRGTAILNAFPDMLFVIDRSGRYVDCHIPPPQQSIVKPEVFLFQKMSDFLPSSLVNEAMEYIEKVLAGEHTSNHNYQLETDNGIRNYEARYTRYSENSVMVLVRDTTEMEKAKQRIRESEHKYRTLVEQATDGIYIANFQGNILGANAAGCKMTQYTEDELLQMRFHDLADAEELKARPLKLPEIASGKTVTSERKMKRKDGEFIDVELAARMIAPNRLLSFVRDITVRKKAENELIRSKEQLRQLTNYIENARENERLNISRELHEELGQQLAVLKMGLSRLAKKSVPGNGLLTEGIHELDDSINKMIETVRKLSLELRPGMLDDIGLAATLEWYCEDFTGRTGIQSSFASTIADEQFSQEIKINMFRIFEESLVNIARHSEAKNVDVSIMHHDQQLILIIRDNGKGFNVSDGDYNETGGIGVMIDRAMKLRGTYKLDSAPGQGTAIEVAIPLTNAG